jgi:hypothetical protein
LVFGRRKKRNDPLNAKHRVILWPVVVEDINLERTQFTVTNKQDATCRILQASDVDLSIAASEVSGDGSRRVIRHGVIDKEANAGHLYGGDTTTSVLRTECRDCRMVSDEEIRNDYLGKTRDVAGRILRDVRCRPCCQASVSTRPNGSHHPARASKATMLKTADRVLGVHGFVTPVLCYWQQAVEICFW